MNLKGQPAAIIYVVITVVAATIITITFVNPSTSSYAQPARATSAATSGVVGTPAPQ